MAVVQEIFRQLGRLFIWLVVVAPWEQALRVRLGKRVKLLNAGVFLAIPFIDRIYRQSVRRRLRIVQPQTLTTRDRRQLCIGGAVGYTITDILKLYSSVHSPDETIAAMAQAAIAEYVATHDYDECRPELIEAHVVKQMDLDRYGLGESEFYITNFVSTKTYRFVTGAFQEYGGSGSLDVSTFDSAQNGVLPR